MATNSDILRCPACGTKNRIPQGRAADMPKCGKCGASMAGGGKPEDVTDADFGTRVLSYKGPVLVDCWAPWCGPCRSVAPVLDKLAMEMKGQLKIAKLNVDENPNVAGRFGIQSIPTMLVMQNGQEVDRIVGALPEGQLRGRLQRFL